MVKRKRPAAARKGGDMESFGPILGMSMIVLGLLMLLFALGLLVWHYWPRPAGGGGPGGTAVDPAPESQSGDGRP